MAQRGIREIDAKNILRKHLNNYSNIDFKISSERVLVTKDSDFKKILVDYPFLGNKKLVCKPDQLIGKRGKNNLLLLNASFDQVIDFVNEKSSSPVKIGKSTGYLTHFLVEPYVPHDEEFYVAIKTERDYDVIYFSKEGGIDIEDNWERVKEIKIPIRSSTYEIKALVENLVDNDLIVEFVNALYTLFVDFDFSYLEINPFTVLEDIVVPLDMVAKLDDTASFKNKDKWSSLDFPPQFGTKHSPEELYVKNLDEKTGASLKLTLLNPNGKIWTLVAGGGASVIYTDTIVDLGHGKELANYGEYSGNPKTDETYEYTKTILDLMTRNGEKGKVLIVGGGIANFTDVAKTFTGIIKALHDYSVKLRDLGVKIYVRRGGPNYEAGLRDMKKTGEHLGLDIKVFGPETHITKIVPMAIEESEMKK